MVSTLPGKHSRKNSGAAKRRLPTCPRSGFWSPLVRAGFSWFRILRRLTALQFSLGARWRRDYLPKGTVFGGPALPVLVVVLRKGSTRDRQERQQQRAAQKHVGHSSFPCSIIRASRRVMIRSDGIDRRLHAHVTVISTDMETRCGSMGNREHSSCLDCNMLE